MTRQWTQRIVAGLLILFLLAYVAFQVYRYFYNPISTETVHEYTVSRSLETRGIVIRDEVLLDQASTGAEFYPLENASRVAVDEPLAELYGAQRSSGSLERTRALEEELQMLQQAQNTPLDYANTEVFNRDIKTLLGEMAAMASNGRYDNLDTLRSNLASNMNRKQISSGREQDYSQRIQQLEDALSQISGSQVANSAAVIKAPLAGYFSNKVDGYETALNTAMLEEMVVQDYIALLQGEGSVHVPSRIGKLVLSEKWFFAAVVPAYETEWINELRKEAQLRGNTLQVDMQFDQVNTIATATIYDIIEDKNSEYAVLLLRSNMMNDELINLRIHDAVLSFQQFTGIRINAPTIRFVVNEEGESERGVYILDDRVVRFKKIDPIYEESGFVLSQTYYVDSQEQDHVRLFDQVITKGTDLYDGKTIQEY